MPRSGEAGALRAKLGGEAAKQSLRLSRALRAKNTAAMPRTSMGSLTAARGTKKAEAEASGGNT